MAKEGYDLLLTAGGKTVSMVDSYGSGVVEYKRPEFQSKKVATNDWVMEDGEEIFFPSGGLKTSAGDLEVSMCYAGAYKSWPGVKDKLVPFLRSAVFTVEDAYNGTSYEGCYFSGLSNEDVFSDESAGDVVTYSLKFRVTKP